MGNRNARHGGNRPGAAPTQTVSALQHRSRPFDRVLARLAALQEAELRRATRLDNRDEEKLEAWGAVRAYSVAAEIVLREHGNQSTGPGERVVDGQVLYSAAWLGDAS